MNLQKQRRIDSKKADKEYQNIIRSMPCSFCGDNRDCYVSWHHLKCIGQTRSASWSTIPVCDSCHKECHNYVISRNRQKDRLLAVWEKIGDYVVSVTQDEISYKAWGELGASYWEKVNSMIENGLIKI